MKNKFLTLILILLLIPAVSAYNVQINLNSNLADFNTDVYKCTNSACSNINFYDSVNSGTAKNIYSLTGSGNDYYSEYDYKICNIPHIYVNHVWDPYASTETFSIDFSKKSGCEGVINSGSLSKNNIFLGESVLISANVQSAFEYPDSVPKTTAIPSSIKNEYSSKTKLELYANNLLIESKEKEILLDANEGFEFSWTPNSVGIYVIKVKSIVNDCACSSQNTQEKIIGTLIVTKSPECTIDSDCGTNYYSNKYCYNDDSYKDFHYFSCLTEECKEDINKILVEHCDYGCSNGDCNPKPEPVCGNGILETGEECDDGNKLNGDGCDSICKIEKIECCSDGDCPDDVALPPTCKNNDVFGSYIDYFCLNKECKSEIKSFFVLDCGEDSYSSWDNYCQGNDLYKQRNYHQKGCAIGACYSNTILQNQFVLHCDYGCSNGACNPKPEPVCGNGILETGEECDDGNKLNGDGCDSICKIETNYECCTDSQCSPDSYSNNYCYNEDVYKDFTDFFCENRKCLFSITKQLFEDCKYGCSNGACNPEPPSCILDSDCQADYYSDNYCKSGDVYKTFYDFSCKNQACFKNSVQQLVKECDYGCKNGECKEKPEDDDENGNVEDNCADENENSICDDEEQFTRSLGIINYDNLELITLGPETTIKPEKTNLSCWFWIWFLIILLAIVLIILLLSWILK